MLLSPVRPATELATYPPVLPIATVHTAGVSDVTVTGRPDEALTTRGLALPIARLAGAVKLIDCAALAPGSGVRIPDTNTDTDA